MLIESPVKYHAQDTSSSEYYVSFITHFYTTMKQTSITLAPSNILKYMVNVQDFIKQQLRQFV